MWTPSRYCFHRVTMGGHKYFRLMYDILLHIQNWGLLKITSHTSTLLNNFHEPYAFSFSFLIGSYWEKRYLCAARHKSFNGWPVSVNQRCFSIILFDRSHLSPSSTVQSVQPVTKKAFKRQKFRKLIITDSNLYYCKSELGVRRLSPYTCTMLHHSTRKVRNGKGLNLILDEGLLTYM